MYPEVATVTVAGVRESYSPLYVPIQCTFYDRKWLLFMNVLLSKPAWELHVLCFNSTNPLHPDRKEHGGNMPR